MDRFVLIVLMVLIFVCVVVNRYMVCFMENGVVSLCFVCDENVFKFVVRLLMYYIRACKCKDVFL